MTMGIEKIQLDDRVHLANWDEHYDRFSGKDLVLARQAVYGCTDDPVDYDEEVLQLIKNLHVDRDATFLDVGSSRPDFSEKIHRAGYNGLLFALDPNSRQFGHRPFWRPKNPNQEHHDDISLELLFELYEKQGDTDPEHQGIMLIEARAERIPLPTNFVTFCSEMFSLYHVTEIDESLAELNRVVDERGYNAMTLSRNKNKSGMHKDQERLEAVLSESLKEEIIGPPPLHQGFTVEDAEVHVPPIFENSYIKNIDAELVFDTPERVQIVLEAHRSQANQFKTKSGRAVDPEIFNIALEATVQKDLERGIELNRPVTDIASRAIIVSSQTGFDVADDQYCALAS
jgi:hypothetical protein